MLKASYENQWNQFAGMAASVRAVAAQHLARGEEAAAGILYVTAARLDSLFEQWANVVELVIEDRDDAPETCQAQGCFAEVPSPGLPYCEKHRAEKTKPRACRHDFVASETRGEVPPKCSKCGAPKNPNGRPRSQQIIKPEGAS